MAKHEVHVSQFFYENLVFIEILVVTSMYPPHSGAIGPIKLLTGVSNLEHFLTSLMGISSATLSLSLPLFLKKMILITLSIAQHSLLT